MKVLFIDVDGTLVGYDNCLPQSAVNAIRETRNRGNKVFLCTGRSRAEIYREIWDIGLDGLIGGNGSYVEAEGKVLYENTLTLQQCTEIVDYLHAQKLEFYIESNNGLFASENFEEAGRQTMITYSGRKGKADADQMTVRKAFPEMIFGGELYRSDVNKISYILNSYQDHLNVANRFPDLKNGTWGGAGSTALFGDVGVKAASKLKAVEIVLDHYGVKPQDTVAFGDGDIDIEMLLHCGLGVAMGNGSQGVKAAADYVTDTVENDGLMKAFRKLELI